MLRMHSSVKQPRLASELALISSRVIPYALLTHCSCFAHTSLMLCTHIAHALPTHCSCPLAALLALCQCPHLDMANTHTWLVLTCYLAWMFYQTPYVCGQPQHTAIAHTFMDCYSLQCLVC